MDIKKDLFGHLPDGRAVHRYTMYGSGGIEVSILDYGGMIQRLLVPDRNGSLADVVTGYDDPLGYSNPKCDQGALVGRFANRIAKGHFTLDGVSYSLFCNNGENHLHGGKEGFHHKLWEVTPQNGAEPTLVLHYLSPDGEEGYPGNLDLTVTYTLKAGRVLSIYYRATTDKKTVLNLTNHAYFNLGGYDSGDIYSHTLWMDADTYLPTDQGLIPTGELASVAGTAMDFQSPVRLGDGIAALHNARGYDNCFNLRGGGTDAPILRAVLSHEASGRELRVYTDQPCIQLYTANFMSCKDLPLKGGYTPMMHGAVCLETQRMPDSPNHTNFTDTTLSPGEVFESTTAYEFTTK